MDDRQKVARPGEFLEENLKEPNHQESKQISEQDCEMGRAQDEPHVVFNLLDILFEALLNLCRERPGDEITRLLETTPILLGHGSHFWFGPHPSVR